MCPTFETASFVLVTKYQPTALVVGNAKKKGYSDFCYSLTGGEVKKPTSKPVGVPYFTTLIINGRTNQLNRVITMMLTRFITKPAFIISFKGI